MKIAYKLALAVILTMAPVSAFAHDTKHSSLHIMEPHVRITIAARPGAGYMTIHNKGEHADRIVAASTPMADRVELHSHTMTDGVMRMRRIDGVDVPGKGKAIFERGGNHLMLFGLKHDVKPGTKIPITLEFEKAGEITMEFTVQGATDTKDHDHSMKHGDTKKHDGKMDHEKHSE